MSVRILIGDVRARLRDLPDESVHCVVTSPPYWGLRDYGVAGQLGLERTLVEHIAVMVEVFREVRRVLRRDGTVWLNYGDCYAASPNGRSAADTKAAGNDDRTFRDKPFSTIGGALKAKDLCMIPNRLAIALQEDGWWVRSEIIWHKPNPMPESITDRPGTAHEKIFLLSRSARYFYDAEAVLQPASLGTHARLSQDIENQVGSFRANGGAKTNGPMKAVRGRTSWKGSTFDGPRDLAVRPDTGRKRAPDGCGIKNNASMDAALAVMPETRNLRNVWTIPIAGFSDAHFATFPPALVEPCIKAGCPSGGTVLDPFFGAGTTGLVADRLGRHCIGIELNPEYAAMAQRRIADDAGMFAKVDAA